MSATAGKVALVSNTTALSGTGCPFGSTVVDFVGFGGANCSETAPTPVLTNTTAAIRAVHGCTEVDNNSTDFSTSGAPAPRNTTTAAAPCGGGDAAPTVASTTPANNATNVAIASNIVINFSESVTASASAFTLACPAGSPQTFTQSASPATTFTLTPNSPLPNGTVCTVTVLANQISDTDAIDPPDAMAANYVFSFTTVNPVDAAPAVTTTTPVNGATNIAVDSAIGVNFSESVTAGVSGFTVQCGATQSISVSGSPGVSLTLNHAAALPYSTLCTVTVTAANISDTDSNDPPDHPVSDYVFSFTTAAAPPPGAANVIINEVDADTPGNDAAEFVELYDGGAGLTPLDGLTVVFYQGEDHTAYATFDLDGYTTDANGYFTLGNPGVPGASLIFAPGQFGLLQNGADAVGLFVGNATDFPIGSPVTTAGLLDAIVYDTDDADDATLLQLLNAGQPQVNENFFGLKADQSLQRCTNGSGGKRNTSTYLPATPTPNAPATCTPLAPRPASDIVISQLYGGGGNSGAPYSNDYVELYNRGAATVDIAGWSLQYASSTGSGWDSNKTPLGGTIGPGEYYLISLASQNTAVGGPFPVAPNVSGLINMSGTAGKIALVDNYDALLTNCPTWNNHVKDLVGYGTAADCREGATNAPAPSNTTALFRKNGGNTDTDVNGSDLVTGAPLPRRTAPIVEFGPNVVGSDPASNGINAPRDATIQVTFTEPVNVVDPWFDITCVTSGPHASFTQAGSGQNHYITPNVNFAAGEQCTVTVFKDQVHDVDTDDSGPFTDTMPANYVWSFTVASGTAPPYPASVHLTLGNPSNAVADVSQFDNYLMEKPEFTLSYNRDLGRPNWVSSHLSDEWFGTLARIDTFRADPTVPADWYRVQSFDFSGSGFDRGHLVPNADRDKETSVPINQATFLMTNMMAQAPDNNQGVWAALEGDLRTLAGSTNELYIVAGPEGVGGTGSNGFATTTANGHVTVPANTWKVALILPKGTDDVNRVTCSTRTIAVIIPNIQGVRFDPWQQYLTTVDAVEALTGYDFFSNLPAPIQACIEARKDGDPVIPLDTTPPTVNCASPDGSWHASNVSLLCTATDGGSGLANPGDASFSLSTSVGLAEDANASTGSRTVCDVAGNCTTAGPIAGNKIDQLDPVITLTTPGNGAVYHQNQVMNAAYTCTDGGSLVSCTGTVANLAAINTATAGSKSFVVNATDAAGNTSSSTVTYIVDDNVAPNVVCGSADGVWHAGNVSILCTASDTGGSGLANAGDASFSLVTSVVDDVADANATTDFRNVCDAAGNCTQAGPIGGNMIDRADPVITLTTPPNGATYEVNQVVNAAYSCVDAGSGFGTCLGSVANGAAIDTSTTGPKSFVVNATDAVGNTSSSTVAYTVADTVAPNVVCGSADTNWHAGNVTITCTASDTGSGLANTGDASFSLVTSVADGFADANAASDSRNVCDVSGNCTQAGPFVSKVDRTNPVITLTTPSNGAEFQMNQAVNAAYGCADSGSGLGTCAGTVADLAAIDTSSLGTKTFVVNATDATGNTSNSTVTYTVVDTVAPSVVCAPADGAWHAGNVSFSCTASDSGSGLANAGDAAFSLVTSVAGDVEDGSAASDSRSVCDAAGNCSPAGPITGNKIDRKDPTIILTTPPNGAVYQLNKVVNAAYACADTGSGSATCAGPVANLAAIDTSSVGGKTFVVTATDAVGNTSSTTANYNVVTSSITISNIPASGFVGGSFVATFGYPGDGATSVTSSTPGRCTVSGGTVTFARAGTCTLVAQAAGTANFDPVTGAAQSFTITKQTATISITNIPGAAVYGGTFTPAFAYTGNGNTRARSETPATCRVNDGDVRFVGAGTCTLTARASETAQYDNAIGDPQSFTIAQAVPTISIDNIPADAKFGGRFRPTFDYSGRGGAVKSATSSTPAVCVFDGPRVEFVGVGTCTLTAAATATDDYTAATGSPQSFTVGQATPTIRITGIPAKPKVGKSFTPNFNYAGDGLTSVTSSTPAICSVAGAVVNFVSAGTCTLTAQGAATTNFAAATGVPESFTVKVDW